MGATAKHPLIFFETEFTSIVHVLKQRFVICHFFQLVIAKENSKVAIHINIDT